MYSSVGKGTEKQEPKPMTKNEKREKRHLGFIMGLGDRLVWKSTDGGPKVKKEQEQPAGKLGKGGRFARSVRRRRGVSDSL